MAIEKSLFTAPIDATDLDEDVEVEIFDPEGMSTETPDGGMLIDFSGGQPEEDDIEFGANLAEEMDEGDLQALSSELLGLYHSDRDSRKDWEETYTKGLDQLGLKTD